MHKVRLTQNGDILMKSKKMSIKKAQEKLKGALIDLT